MFLCGLEEIQYQWPEIHIALRLAFEVACTVLFTLAVSCLSSTKRQTPAVGLFSLDLHLAFDLLAVCNIPSPGC